MTTDLPSDEEYMAYVYNVLKDSSYISEIADIYEQAYSAQDRFAVAVAAGAVNQDEFESFSAFTRESHMLEDAFRGKFIQALRDMTLAAIRDDRHRVNGIPVGLLPSRELNACAIATPRGGALILLNHAVIGLLAHFYRCTVAFITWHTATPFCRDASQDAYAEALLGLARSVVTGNFAEVAAHKHTLNFRSLSDYERSTITFCQMMEMFILLHEYGHVIRGHLSTSKLRPAFGGQLPGLRAYSKSELQEFEADEYAIDQIHRAGLGWSDVALVAGLVMKFFELCESLGPPGEPGSEPTHPPAQHRWDRIKARTRLSESPGAFALNLDPAFGVIGRGVQH
jgi:hypothetical protein